VKADADTGYGGVHNVQRTVREYAKADVAAIHIEDQESPKRCGHAAGKRVVSKADAEARIRAAVDARDEMESDLVIIARTDAYGSVNGNWEEHVDRAKLFWDLGADLLLPEMPDNDWETAVRFAEQIHETHPEADLYWNYSSNFQWTDLEDPPTFAELANLGYTYISVSGFGMHAAVHSLYDHFSDLKANEEVAQWRMERTSEEHDGFDRSSDVMFQLADFEEYQRLEEEYLADAAERYAGSAGYQSDST
jgi:isocitrate lyase